MVYLRTNLGVNEFHNEEKKVGGRSVTQITIKNWINKNIKNARRQLN